MKVLRHGDTYESTKCEECKCVFRYVKNDIGENIYEQLYLNAPRQEYVNCPECNHRNVLTTTINL